MHASKGFINHCDITGFFVIFMERLIYMCKEEGKCEFEHDLKGCALKHISKARDYISEDKFEDADVELNYVEKHLKEP